MHMNGKTRLTAGEISALTEKAPVKAEHELRENLVIIPTYNEAINLKLLVLGSRYVPGGGSLRWPLWRRLLSRGGSIYARLMLGLPIHDLTGGFKGFRRQVLEALISELNTIRSNGYAFQIEVTYLCARHGFRIKEVPILFEDRLVGQSKMNRRIIVEGLRVVLALRLNQVMPRARPARRRLAAVSLAVAILVVIF